MGGPDVTTAGSGGIARLSSYSPSSPAITNAYAGGAASDAQFAFASLKVAAYFATLVVCLAHALIDVAPRSRFDRADSTTTTVSSAAVSNHRRRLKVNGVVAAFALLAFMAINFTVTWTMIAKFMIEDYRAFAAITGGTTAAPSSPPSVRNVLSHTTGPASDPGGVFLSPPWGAARTMMEALITPKIDPVTRDWVSFSDWFVKAYEQVAASELQWHWSSGLLLLVCTMTVFVHVESYRCATRGGSNMWLGCVAAISVCTPLMLAAMCTTNAETYFSRFIVPKRTLLSACVVVAAVCVMYLPAAPGGGAFVVALGVMHAAVAAPSLLQQWLWRDCPGDAAQVRYLRFLSHVPRLTAAEGAPLDRASASTGASTSAAASSSRRPRSVSEVRMEGDIRHNVPKYLVHVSILLGDQAWVQRLYTGVSCLAFATLVHNFIQLTSDGGGKLPRNGVLQAWIAAGTANWCQCSVTYDYLATSIAMCSFMWCSRSTPKRFAALATVGCVLLSPTVAIPWYLSVREAYMMQRLQVAIATATVRSTAAVVADRLRRTPSSSPPPQPQAAAESNRPTLAASVTTATAASSASRGDSLLCPSPLLRADSGGALDAGCDSLLDLDAAAAPTVRHRAASA